MHIDYTPCRPERQVTSRRCSQPAARRPCAPLPERSPPRSPSAPRSTTATGSFPCFDEIWAAGLGNLTLPRTLGGVGAGVETSAEAVALLAAGDPSAALVLVMHLAHIPVLALPESACPARVRDAFVESTLAGPALANALRVEPELGTPARGGVPATRAPVRAIRRRRARVVRLGAQDLLDGRTRTALDARLGRDRG